MFSTGPPGSTSSRTSRTTARRPPTARPAMRCSTRRRRGRAAATSTGKLPRLISTLHPGGTCVRSGSGCPMSPPAMRRCDAARTLETAVLLSCCPAESCPLFPSDSHSEDSLGAAGLQLPPSRSSLLSHWCPGCLQMRILPRSHRSIMRMWERTLKPERQNSLPRNYGPIVRLSSATSVLCALCSLSSVRVLSCGG